MLAKHLKEAKHSPDVYLCGPPGMIDATIAAAWLIGQVRANDAVLIMGGGKSYRIAELLVRSLVG